MGTTNVEGEKSNLKPSKAAIMATKVLISNGFEPRRARLGYNETAKKRKLGSKTPSKRIIKPNLYQYFNKKIIINTNPNAKASSQINSTAFTPDDAGKSNRQEEEEEIEEETLRELERPKLQSGAEELEVINLGEGEEIEEVWIGKLTPPDVKQGLTKLLREYADIFAWSYRDMPGLDTTIVEHRLPLIPNAIPVW
ncbi:hypothetical protein CR513_25596, partial [Mucuna pruriens]